MKKMLRYLVLATFIICYKAPDIWAQVQPTTAKAVSTQVDRFYGQAQAEQVFLHIDKPFYGSRDTIWLKAYLFNQAFEASAKSGLLYVELINDTGKVALRQCLPVQGGISYGQLALSEKQMQEGRYQLRAYTNWMQNQGTESFFSRPIYIRSAAQPWLVSTRKRATVGSSGQLGLVLRLTTADGRPVGLHPVQVLLSQGSRVLGRQTLETSAEGELLPEFKLPEKAGRGSLQYILQEPGRNADQRHLVIPLEDAPADIDLQFLPEGGHLVAGLVNRVAFKAVDGSGKGTNVNGTITDGAGKTVARFQSAHLGMGTIELAPATGQTYTASIHLPGNRVQNVTFPVAEPRGIVLRAENPEHSDSLTISLQSTPGQASDAPCFLLGQAAGSVIYAARVSFRSSTVTAKIPKAAFPTGIARFTLLSAKLQSVAERLVFVDHGDAPETTLQIRSSPAEAGKPVSLQISLTDWHQQPLPANLSLSVTDDRTVRADSSNISNIRSYMLLCGNLAGYIEEPGYYFDPKYADRYSSLDLLLLTQGWAGYSWQQVFQPNFHPVFAAEQALQISGQLSRTGGKAIAGLPVMLLSTRKPLTMMDTVSDQNGRFIFRHVPPYDTASFMVQVKNRKGKMFEATVAIDPFIPAKVGLQKQPDATAASWYVNAQSENLDYLKTSQAYTAYRDSLTYGANAIRLKGVTIRATKFVRGSQNLNGPGKADQIL
ncbi:MAG: carboxypeptidase regulatory-like domain-containing protein, partial [Hymenobacter sp.]